MSTKCREDRADLVGFIVVMLIYLGGIVAMFLLTGWECTLIFLGGCLLLMAVCSLVGHWVETGRWWSRW